MTSILNEIQDKLLSQIQPINDGISKIMLQINELNENEFKLIKDNNQCEIFASIINNLESSTSQCFQNLNDFQNRINSYLYENIQFNHYNKINQGLEDIINSLSNFGNQIEDKIHSSGKQDYLNEINSKLSKLFEETKNSVSFFQNLNNYEGKDNGMNLNKKILKTIDECVEGFNIKLKTKNEDTIIESNEENNINDLELIDFFG